MRERSHYQIGTSIHSNCYFSNPDSFQSATILNGSGLSECPDMMKGFRCAATSAINGSLYYTVLTTKVLKIAFGCWSLVIGKDLSSPKANGQRLMAI